MKYLISNDDGDSLCLRKKYDLLLRFNYLLPFILLCLTIEVN